MVGVPFIRRGVLTKDWKNKYLPFLIPITFYLAGYYYEKQTQRYARSYHNRSMQYGGRDLKPGQTLWD